jgi:carbamoyl-phosphate synthase large subunit
VLATKGTAGVLERAGIAVERVAKVSEGGRTIADRIRDGEVDLVINTPFGRGPRTDGYFIRTAAAQRGVPCITTLPGVMAALRGIESLVADRVDAPANAPRHEPRSLQELHLVAASASPVQGRLVLGGEQASVSP